MVNVGLDRFICHELVEQANILFETVLYVGNPLVHRGRLEFNKGFDLGLQGFQLV